MNRPQTLLTAANNKLTFMAMAVIALLTTSAAQAVVIDGSISRTGGAALGADGQWYAFEQNSVQTTVGKHYFNVNSAGVVTIDVLSWEGNPNQSITSPPTDVNGDGEIAFFDTTIRLYDANTNALIGFNDDSPSTFGDGSIFDRDSYLSLGLTTGAYFLAVGSFDLSDADVLTGPAFGSGPMTWNGSRYVVSDHGDYRLTIAGDITLVPEPSTLAIFGLGLTVIGAARRRKAARPHAA